MKKIRCTWTYNMNKVPWGATKKTLPFGVFWIRIIEMGLLIRRRIRSFGAWLSELSYSNAEVFKLWEVEPPPFSADSFITTAHLKSRSQHMKRPIWMREKLHLLQIRRCKHSESRKQLFILCTFIPTNQVFKIKILNSEIKKNGKGRWNPT